MSNFQKFAEMEFTSPRNVHAHRASLRLYEESHQRTQRKLQRAKELEPDAKTNSQQFKASPLSNLILRRASIRNATSASVLTIEPVTPSVGNETVDDIFVTATAGLEALASQKKSGASRLVSANASTQPSPNFAVIEPDIREVFRIPSPDPVPRCERIAWGDLFDAIFHDTLGNA